MDKEVQEKYEDLLTTAKKYLEKAYSPYSKIKVGSAVLSSKGNIYGGCNIENASYGLTNCAERVAIQKMVSEGETKFKAILIISNLEDFLYPCGACRQVMTEFAENNDPYVFIVRKKDEAVELYRLSALIPYALKKGNIKNQEKLE